MANIAKWTSPGAWTSCGFTAADFNSLANGSAVVATSSIDNSTNLDLLADVSLIATMGGTTVASSIFTLMILPRNRDGSTFGDSSPTGASSTPPSATYWAGAAGVRTGITSGNTVTAMFRGILLPPGLFRFALINNLGVALNATAAVTAEYRAYGENLNG